MADRVAVLAIDDIVPLDFGIATQLFGYPEAPYRLAVCGARRGTVSTTGPYHVQVSAGLQALAEADTVLVPGFEPHTRQLPRAVLAHLRAAYARGCRMVSICTGAFALAAAGVLDGHRATTHWRLTSELAARYPNATVDPDVLYVDDGQVLTSAGVAAGLDLCLHLIRNDFGAAVANAIARQIVVAPYRDGGQAQYIERALPDDRQSPLSATRTWALHHLDETLSVAELAAHAAVSERTFARRFVAETGTTPQRWLAAQRLDLARELLERSDASIDEIADRSGLGSADNLRNYFRRHLRTSPTAYRRAFALASNTELDVRMPQRTASHSSP
jgi:transcriptional regulator GlxA family with amidase domain